MSTRAYGVECAYPPRRFGPDAHETPSRVQVSWLRSSQKFTLSDESGTADSAMAKHASSDTPTRQNSE